MRVVRNLLILSALSVAVLVASEWSDRAKEPFVARMRITLESRDTGQTMWSRESERETVQARSRSGDFSEDGILGPNAIRVYHASNGLMHQWTKGSRDIGSKPELSREQLLGQGPTPSELAAKAERFEWVAGEKCHVFRVMSRDPVTKAPKKIGELCRSLELDAILRYEFVYTSGGREFRHLAEVISVAVGVEPDRTLFAVPAAAR